MRSGSEQPNTQGEEEQWLNSSWSPIPAEETAEQARNKLIELQQQNLITLADAAVAIRGADGKVKVKQVNNLVGAGALSGAFWGTLLGFIFLVPLVGMAAGAAAGALSGKAMDIGVDDRFIKNVGDKLVPGTSALFVLSIQSTPDRVINEMKVFGGEIIETNLSQEQEDRLREAFSAS